MKVFRNLIILVLIVVAATIVPQAMHEYRPLEKAVELALETLIQLPPNSSASPNGNGGPLSSENQGFINAGAGNRCFPTAQSPTLKCIPRNKNGQICQVGDCLPAEFERLPSLEQLNRSAKRSAPNRTDPESGS